MLLKDSGDRKVSPDHALTINENFTNEPFTELWVIPVAGGLKDQFKGPDSMLLSFLIHRRSKDNFAGLYNHFAHRAFQQWCDEGMPGDPKEFCLRSLRYSKTTFSVRSFRKWKERWEHTGLFSGAIVIPNLILRRMRS
ncbi:MAG: hypothetical protein V7K90_19585 [Nostoc sp.]|uniref:hypothetical protein n=1 Tax=Nostoc sp. TaxID=1180 RepID=UPI002FF88202